MPPKKTAMPNGKEVSSETRKLLAEVKKCRDSLAYFASTYCKILASSDRSGAWIPFTLWPAQEQVAADVEAHREVIALKARQLGFTWLVVAFALQQMLFHPIQTVLFFSQRDDEAAELLGFRLKEMYRRLPAWMQEGLVIDNEHEVSFKNGSRAMSFATTGGRSYTATLAIIDEADFVPDLAKMMNAVQPTIDAGGRLILLSTVDKSQPESTFKRIFRGAKAGENSFRGIFHGWDAAPWRTPEWYEEKKRSIMVQTGALDDLHQEFPATEAEALSPRSLDKRIPAQWLQQCYQEMKPIDDADTNPAPAMRLPPIPGLVAYVRPRPDRTYVIGADPAEGNPTSDDSALCVLDTKTGEEVASLAGKFEPSVFASYASMLSAWFNGAPILCERNNHGHAVILWFTNFAPRIRLLCGHDAKPGWMSSTLGKTTMYSNAADAFKNKETVLHSFATFTQLASIDGNTLRAPEGQNDDRADAFALAVCARLAVIGDNGDGGEPCVLIPGRDLFGEYAVGGKIGSVGDDPYGAGFL